MKLRALGIFAVTVMLAPCRVAAQEGLPETIRFAGPDGVSLVGYLFRPPARGRAPAVVMMHGRAPIPRSRAGNSAHAPCRSGI